MDPATIPDPDRPLRATIVLRPPESGIAAELLAGTYDPSTRTSTSADPKGMAAVEGFARSHGLRVEESDTPGRRVVVSGPARQITSIFGDNALPPDIAKHVLAVLGLDSRPVARPRGM